MIKLSRTMSYILRHKPEDFSLTLDEAGRISISELAEALEVTTTDIITVAETDDKSRFVISDEMIWAAQGHSFSVTVPMQQIDTPGIIFHGTKVSNIDSIMKSGLLPGSRTMVHLSRDFDTAVKVASRRKGDSVILKIDGNALAKQQVVFESANKVILTKKVPSQFITIIEEV